MYEKIAIKIFTLILSSEMLVKAEPKKVDHRPIIPLNDAGKNSHTKSILKEQSNVEVHAARTATLQAEDLQEFSQLPEKTQILLRYALELTRKNLAYRYGSSEPETGGLDCSGFVYHLLQKHGVVEVPRQSNEMYAWVWRAGTFHAFNGVTIDSFEFEKMRPGNLLFWTRTTQNKVADRDPPVTHVMIYLGKRKSDGKQLVVGSSEGRTFEGQKMFGVSVFDFKIPTADSESRLIGYANLP